MKPFAIFALTSCLLATAGAAPLLEDAFSGPALDTNTWQVVLPYAQSHVTQTNGWLTMVGRGSLETRSGFDVPVEVSGRFTLNSGAENFGVKLRSDLSINTSPYYGQFYEITGVQVVFSADNSRIYIHAIDRTNNVIPVLASVPFVFQAGHAYDFTITDDKSNVNLTVDGTNVLSAATTFATGNQIAFQSREWPSTATSLGFVTISETPDNPPTVTELLTNYDFEAGNVGFETDSALPPEGSPDPGPGYYGVISDPHAFNGFFASYGDHTSGSGLMLITDCFTTPSKTIWRQKIKVEKNSDYRFSLWAANPYPGLPPTLQVFINGQQQGTNILVPSQPGVWKSASADWNSLDSTQAVLEIRNATIGFVGNDVTLDDLSFRGPAPATAPPVILAIEPTNAFVNEGDDVVFTAAVEGSSPLAYQWLFNGDSISDATNATLTLSDVVFAQAGSYRLVVAGPGGAASADVFLAINRAPIADASATRSLFISANGSNAVAVLDGSLSSDPDGDSLSYEWFLDATGDQLLLQDDFDGSDINTNLWRVLLPYAQSHVFQTNGWLTMIGRGTLATGSGFDMPLALSGKFALTSGAENFGVKLRSDLSINTSAYYGQFYEMTGVQVVFSADNNRIYIHAIGRTNSVIPVLASVPFAFQVGRAYQFTVTDDKTNLNVMVDGTNVLSAATNFATGDQIAFQSREFPDTATSLDRVTISELQPDGIPLATGVVVAVTLPLGTNALRLVVNDGMASDRQDFAVEVITTSEAVERLAALAGSSLDKADALAASLRAALASIGRGQPETAVNQLNAFINKVHAQLDSSNPELAAELIASAQAIIDALNGGSRPAIDPVQITSISHGNSGKSHLKIKGAPGNVYIIETSTNMVDWKKIGTATAAGGNDYEFDDTPTAPAAVRYFRVVAP